MEYTLHQFFIIHQRISTVCNKTKHFMNGLKERICYYAFICITRSEFFEPLCPHALNRKSRDVEDPLTNSFLSGSKSSLC